MRFTLILVLTIQASGLCAQDTPTLPPATRVERDIAYSEAKDVRQMLDIYIPASPEKAPVVFWIHGGGWQAGDKTQVGSKPSAFTTKGYVFVATNYRFVPHVKMDRIVRDVAKSVRWVYDHAAAYGGDPSRIILAGHSAGAQLAALLCVDDSYLRDEGLSLAVVKGCIPVDGDTYDIPLQVATAGARRKKLGQPDPKFGHPEKFGPPDLQRRFSAVRHITRDKRIPPFLILHVADHTDTTAQAHRLWSELREAGIPAKVVGAAETDHVKLDSDLGIPSDASTTEIFTFLEAALKNELTANGR